jgi:hypothetical protein
MKFSIRLFLSGIFLFSSSVIRGQSSLTDSLFHPDSLRHLVEVLASDSMEGRFTGERGNNQAALFIANEFKNAGLNHIAGNEGFFMPIKNLGNNVMGAIQGKSKPGQVIIFSAHYDHVGIKNSNPYAMIIGKGDGEDEDVIFNGANDNASGVAAVITLAKYFKQVDNNERTLVFVTFTGEELGLLGSQAFVESIEPDSIVAVINIEMIGRSESKRSKPYITGDGYSNLIKILNRNYRELGDKTEKEYFKMDPYVNQKLFARSDNFSFASKKIPAHTIMLTPPDDKFYHNPNDEANTLNYEAMKNVIKAIAYGVTGIVTGIDTPTRINRLW